MGHGTLRDLHQHGEQRLLQGTGDTAAQHTTEECGEQCLLQGTVLLCAAAQHTTEECGEQRLLQGTGDTAAQHTTDRRIAETLLANAPVSDITSGRSAHR